VDWNLLTCGIEGHISYAPEESGLRARLQATSADGQAWRCLRCGTFVPGEPTHSGPAAQAPAVRRGKELRSAFILRLFAVERFLRGIAVAVIAFAIWRFKYSRSSIEQAFNRELPVVRSLLRDLGFNIDHSKLIGLIRHAFTLDPHTLTWLALAASGYALIELLEATGLWLLKRWGEYFAMVATSVGIPYEIYDLTGKVTVLRLLFFAVNLALVVYLVLTKRLLGARGGKKAYDARLRSESIIDSALAAQDGFAAAQQRAAAPAADVPPHGPDVPPGRSDVPPGRSDVPPGRSDVPPGTADARPDGPDVPAGRSDVPANTADARPDGPDVPVHAADARPDGRDVPADGRDVPVDAADARPDGPDVPAGRSDVPANTADARPDGRDVPVDAADARPDGRDVPPDTADVRPDGRHIPADTADVPLDAADVPAGRSDIPPGTADGSDVPSARPAHADGAASGPVSPGLPAQGPRR
jgi:uncharacterized membrane protein (DUF2068 family)